MSNKAITLSGFDPANPTSTIVIKDLPLPSAGVCRRGRAGAAQAEPAVSDLPRLPAAQLQLVQVSLPTVARQI